jgi:hypothetical protein
MAEDKSYQSAIHATNGGTVLQVGSTGTIELYGNLVNVGAAGIRSVVASAIGASTSTTGATAVGSTDVTMISSTGSTGASAFFRLAKPSAVGIEKRLLVTSATTGKTAVMETTGLSVSVGYTKTYHRITFNAADQFVLLHGSSANRWAIAAAGSPSSTNSIAFSTNWTTG